MRQLNCDVRDRQKEKLFGIWGLMMIDKISMHGENVNNDDTTAELPFA